MAIEIEREKGAFEGLCLVLMLLLVLVLARLLQGVEKSIYFLYR